MTATPSAKPRARRIAADEAHSWARNLRLRNPYAKLVLCMSTLYVNGDGTCFVGIKELSKDCELAEETVRRRLVWLEGVGAVTRMPQWIDENGRRNGEGRGKRTTDEIRLMIDADAEEIEARASGEFEGDADAETDTVSPVHRRGLTEERPTISPVHGRGLTDDEKGVSPPVSPLAAPSLRRGPDSSEPEPEQDPPTPLGGKGLENRIEEGEARTWAHAESWSRFEAAWREPILHQTMCRQIWSAFTDSERETAIKVARGYVNWRTSQKRPPNTCNPQKVLREVDAWPRFVQLAGPDPALRTFVPENSQAFAGIRVLCQIGSWKPPITRPDAERNEVGYWRLEPPPVDLIALSAFADKPIDGWDELSPDSIPFKAWASRIHEWIGAWPKTLRVPCPYPPRKDGSFPANDQTISTNDDHDKLGKTG